MGGSKRKAEDASTVPDKIAMTHADGSAPFAVYFPSGFNPEKAAAECEWESYEHAKKKNQYALVAKTAHNVDFLGSTLNLEHSTAAPCRFSLGVFDRTSGNLEIAPVQGGRVLRMEPRARGLNYLASVTSPTANQTLESRRERNAKLVQEFGSQRRKRQLAAAKSAAVEAAQVSGGDAILGLIASAGAKVDTRDAVVAASLANRNIPPHHPEARTGEEAYRLEEIVPPSVSDALEIRKLFPAENKPEYRQELRKGKVFGDGYVLSRLPVLGSTDPDTREARAKCLVLLGHLLKLMTGQGGQVVRVRHDESITAAAERLRMPSSVLEGILDLFYSREHGDVGDRYVLSKEKKNLMLGWVLVLAVRAEPQCVLEPESFTALANELKMRGGEVASMYRELGCATIRVAGERAGTKVTLLPSAAGGEKTLADYFPGLKLGGKKPGGR